MATLQKSTASSITCVLQQGAEWPWTMANHQSAVEEADVVQGRIFWLPAEEDLPKRAVERVHGKGGAECVYGYPVVIVSRPAEASHTAHFQIISPLQRRTISDLYHKSNEFLTSRQTGRIPITRSPSHGNASPTTKNQFPTLRLVNGARLRLDSCVNIWNVYKIDWSLLKVYSNPETPGVEQFRFGHKSMRRLLARSAALTKYEPGTQRQTHCIQAPDRTNSWSDIAHMMPVLQGSISESVWVSAENVQATRARRFSDSKASPITSCRCSGAYGSRTSLQSSNGMQNFGSERSPKVLSDTLDETVAHNPTTWAMRHSLDCLFKRDAAGRRWSTMTRTRPRTREKSQLWVNTKGVMAVIIASI